MSVALLVGVQWGVVGLCVGWLVGYVPVFCVTTYRALVTLQVPVGRAIAGMATPLAGGLVMGAGVLGTRMLLAGTLPPAVALAGLSLFGAGIYGALIAAFKPRLLRSLWPLGAGK
jgi:hypothetical protein